MEKNMGGTDRLIRAVIAIVIFTLCYLNVISGWWGITLVVLAVIFLITSFISFCPLYLPFGIKTNKN